MALIGVSGTNITEVSRSSLERKNRRSRTSRAIAWLVVCLAVCGVVTWNVATQQPYMPDSALYAVRTLEFTGKSHTEATAEVAKFYADRHLNSVLRAARLDNRPRSLLFKPRILYPLASAPFVAVFGLPALLVVPVLGFVIAILAVALLSERIFGLPGLIAPLLFLASAKMTSWPVMALTEGVTLALVAGTLLLLPWRAHAASRGSLIGLSALLIALSLTRQVTLMPAMTICLLWLASALSEHRLNTVWLPYAVVAVVVTGCSVIYVQLYSHFSLADNWALALGTNSASASIHRLPHAVAHVLAVDWSALRFIALRYPPQIPDVTAVVAILALVYTLVRRWRSPVVVALAGAVTGNLLLFVANPYPTYLRTWLLVMPAAVIAATGTVIAVGSRVYEGTRGIHRCVRYGTSLKRPDASGEPSQELRFG